MKRYLTFALVVNLFLQLWVWAWSPTILAVGPDCIGPGSGEVQFFTHYNQSGLMGSDCMTNYGTRIGTDNNFGDASDAFRGTDNNDADSWRLYSENTSMRYCLIVADGTSLNSPMYFITMGPGYNSYYGNLPASVINRTSSYSAIQIALGSSC